MLSEPTRDERETARQEARQFLHDELNLTPEQLLAALQQTYGDAYATGVFTALQQDGFAAPNDQGWSQYWDAWQPGSVKDAEQVDNGGLANLLATANVTIQGIIGTTLDQLGTVLADGLRAGDNIDTIAASMSGIVSDPARAYLIADTEVARAVTAGSVFQYRHDGVTMVDLLTSPGACEECLALAAQNPLKVADAIVPVHPRCRCSLTPHTEAMQHPTDQVGLPEQTGRGDLALLGGAALGEEAEATDVAEEREARAAEEERQAEALRERGGMEPPTTVPQPYVVPSAPAYYEENMGGGLTYGEENTGAGMTLGEENTGGGNAAVYGNEGGGMEAGQENPGGGEAYLPTPGPTSPAAPVDTNPVPRKRRRTRRGQPVGRAE